MRFTLAAEERELVAALKDACDNEEVKYRSIFELAKYVLAVRSQIKDNAKDALQKRTKLALKRLKKRRKWETHHGMDKMDSMQNMKEVDKAVPGMFMVRYTTDQEGRVVVGQHVAYSPCDFMFANKGNLAKYLSAAQWHMDLGAADLEEARKGIAVVAVADGLWSMKVAYRYLKILTKASDNAKDMHPNRLRCIYAEIPVFLHHLIEVGRKLLPKKIAERVKVYSTMNELELSGNLSKAQEGTDPMTMMEWCEQRNAIYMESVEKVRL